MIISSNVGIKYIGVTETFPVLSPYFKVINQGYTFSLALPYMPIQDILSVKALSSIEIYEYLDTSHDPKLLLSGFIQLYVQYGACDFQYTVCTDQHTIPFCDYICLPPATACARLKPTVYILDIYATSIDSLTLYYNVILLLMVHLH